MAHRLIAPALATAALLAAAPTAHAALVYVKQASGLHPQVWVARDGGGHARRLGEGTQPVISADGTRVAWRTFGRRDAVFTAATGGGTRRRVVRGRDIGELALSPDGTRLAIGQRRSVVVYDTTTQ